MLAYAPKTTGKTRALEKAAFKKEISESGLLFTYVRPRSTNLRSPDIASQYSHNGGAVFAWRRPASGDLMLTVAVSWCHEREQFDATLGRYLAMQNYNAGKTIMLRLPMDKPGAYSKALKTLFKSCV